MSPRSTLIDGLLEEVGTPFGKRASAHPCQGSKFHSPAPLTTEEVFIGEESIFLCPTCSSKLTIFIHLAMTAPEKITWPVAREFGNQIRALGLRQLSTWGTNVRLGEDHA